MKWKLYALWIRVLDVVRPVDWTRAGWYPNRTFPHRKWWWQ